MYKVLLLVGDFNVSRDCTSVISILNYILKKHLFLSAEMRRKIHRCIKFIVLISVSLCCLIIVSYYLKWKHPEHITQKVDSEDKDSIWVSSIDKRKDEPKVFGPEFGCRDILEIIEEAKKINNNNLTVMLTIVNDVFIDFVYSWLCNTKSMAIDQQLLLLTTDDDTARAIRQDWPNVMTICYDGISSMGEQIYLNVGYVRLMAQRTKLIQQLLNENVQLFLFEVDSIWLQNPLKDLEKIPHGYDMIAVRVISDKLRIFISGGFLVLYPTDQTKYLWNKLTEHMENIYHNTEKYPDTQPLSILDNDQVYLSTLLSVNYADVKVFYLPYSQFPDGRWYVLSDDEKRSSNPVVISNNLIEGIQSKIDRAQKWGHWFIDEHRKCINNRYY